jgi:hypothetical protein
MLQKHDCRTSGQLLANCWLLPAAEAMQSALPYSQHLATTPDKLPLMPSQHSTGITQPGAKCL